MVGPLLAENAKPLPTDLAQFLDQGLPNGHPAVYVSMGTFARLTEDELSAMGSALSSLPNPVLWKLDPLDLPGVFIKTLLIHVRRMSIRLKRLTGQPDAYSGIDLPLAYLEHIGMLAMSVLSCIVLRVAIIIVHHLHVC